MAPDPSAPPELPQALRRATFVLVALAAMAVEVAAADTRPVATSLGLALVWVAVALVLARLVPVPADPRRKPPWWVGLLVLSLGAAPVLTEPLFRRYTGGGYPLELQMVGGLRNVGLALAACAGWALCLRTACVVSLFLMLFSAAMTNHPAVLVLLGLYAAAGSGWLVLVYWLGIRAAFVTSERAVAVEVQQARMAVPWVGLAVLGLFLGGGAALALVGPKRAVTELGELVPTSGGTGQTDPFARYGVGDGPEETAGDNAKTAGMVETDKMIEDNKNSLIDAVNDMYGPPHKPPKDQERTVAAGKADVIENHGKLPENRRPSRDFDTGRKGPPPKDKKLTSQLARGLFEVEGRTPLHVRQVAYDAYDPAGHRWREARQPSSLLLEPEGGDWMRLGHLRESADWYAEPERHRLKAASLGTNLVPTPTLLARVRINKVDRPDYYQWDYDGVLALAGRKKTPPGVVVNTDCRTVAPGAIPEAAFARPAHGAEVSTLFAVPEPIRADVERLAREWAGDRPRGWPQVEAVAGRLRRDYALDPSAAAPTDHPAPVLWFLLESKRGPDYLFATAATLLLRSLDYQARFSLGYYASPEAFDPQTDHTPVRDTDLHTWAEVRLSDGHWLVVEATPGFETLGPKRPLSERLLNALASAGAWIGRHPVLSAGALVLVVLVAARRRHLLDAVAARLWLWRPGPTWRAQVAAAVRLVERRGRWAGIPRAPGQTVSAWVRALPAEAAGDSDLSALTRAAEWASYAPDLPPPWPPGDILAACRAAVRRWTLTRWRAALAPTTGDRS